MKLIVNANVLITNKEGILLLDEIIARYGNNVENVAVNVEPIKDSPVQQTQLPTQQPVQSVQVQTAPTQTVQQTVPVQTVQQPVQTAVPTAAKTYTLEDLQRASGALVQAGKIQQLQGLLQQFNAVSLAHLAQENFGAFALKLRELGADI